MRSMMVMGMAIILLAGAAAGAELPAEVYVDGVRQDFEPPALVRNGVTYAPVRAMAEALGAEVSWHAREQRATVRVVERKPSRRAGAAGASNPMRGRLSKRSDLRGRGSGVPRSVSLARADGITVQGRLLMPLRKLAEALRAEVEWDGSLNRVTVWTKEDEMERMREEMKNHRRRIIYNDDGCGPVWNQEPGGTLKSFLYGPHGRLGADGGAGKHLGRDELHQGPGRRG